PRSKTATHPQATSEVLAVAYHGPSVTSPDVVPLEVLSTHLSTGTEAVLRKKLVDTGIAVSAWGGIDNSPDVFQVFINLAEGKSAATALKVVDQTFASLKKAKIRKAQLT